MTIFAIFKANFLKIPTNSKNLKNLVDIAKQSQLHGMVFLHRVVILR